MNKTLVAQLYELREKANKNEPITQEDVKLAYEVARKLGTIDSRALYASLKRKAKGEQ
jgi:hypothetical protein